MLGEILKSRIIIAISPLSSPMFSLKIGGLKFSGYKEKTTELHHFFPIFLFFLFSLQLIRDFNLFIYVHFFKNLNLKKKILVISLQIERIHFTVKILFFTSKGVKILNDMIV